MRRFMIILVGILFLSCLLIGTTVSTYDPWYDFDDDGDIDIFDIVKIADAYGTSGEPFEAKAALSYDSDWVDISDKQGQYHNITHGLDSTDLLVDIIGKEGGDDAPHQNHYGLTTYTTTPTEWNRTYGGVSYDHGKSVVQTTDGGYAITGCTQSFGPGAMAVRLVKTDAAGNSQWTRAFGGSDPDYAESVVQTTDGGYAMAGYTASFGAGTQDAWLVKTDAAGNHQWNQTYGGVSIDRGYSLVQTTDSGYAIAGYTGSFGAGAYDIWFVKTDALGNAQWNQTYGGLNSDIARSLVQTTDGGYAIAGYTASYGEGSYDFWLVKTDAAGNHQWNQTYGGIDYEYGISLVQTTDGGYAMAGYTASFGAGDDDAWLVKTDAEGNHQWDQTYGGPDTDKGLSLVQTIDGGYAITGHTRSFGAGSLDFWLVKAFEPGATVEVEYGLAWTSSTLDTITLYRGEDDPYWNHVRIRVWEIKETP